MKKLLVLLICAIYSYGLAAQTTPDDMVALFFEDFKKDKGRAIEKIYQTSPWMAKANDAIANLKGEVEKLTPEYVGNMHGFSLICRKQLADCFVLQSYLLRDDRQPIRFTFEFYKPDKEWVLFSISFDATLDDEIEEAVKVYNLSLD